MRDTILSGTTVPTTTTTTKVTTTPKPKRVARPKKPKPAVPEIEEPFLVDVDPIKEQILEAPYLTEPLNEEVTYPPDSDYKNEPNLHQNSLHEEHIGIIIGALAA